MIDDLLAQHPRAAICLSGGKDSTACAYLLRPYAERLTAYHVDTGDLLPETHEVIAQLAPLFPRFVRIKTDAAGWIAKHGLPSDLVPYQSHPIGRLIGQASSPLTSRYDCCWHNLMLPLFKRIQTDGCTLLIRGNKRTDMPRLPVLSGETFQGIVIHHPVEDWTDADVLDYLRRVGAPLSRVYDYAPCSLDCGTCPAWWTDRRAGYLREHYPEKFAAYRRRLAVVADALEPAMGSLAREIVDADIE